MNLRGQQLLRPLKVKTEENTKKYIQKKFKKTGMKGYIKFYKNNKPVWRLAKDGNDPRRKIKRQGLAKFAWWKALQEATGRTKKDKPGLGIVKRYTKGINGLKTIKPFVELQNNLNYVGIIAPNAARRAIKKATSSMAGQLADKAKDLSK